MNESQQREDEAVGAEESAPEDSGLGDAAEDAPDQSEGLDEPSAEDLLVGDGEWDGEADADEEANQAGQEAQAEAETETEAEQTTKDDAATSEESASSGLPSPDDVSESPEEADEEAPAAAEEAESAASEEDDEVSTEAESEQAAQEDEEGEAGDQPLALEDEISEAEAAEVEEVDAPPSLPEQPEDVKGSRETPDQQLEFRSGDRVGGRFTVERYLGSSGGGISYLCREEDAGTPVVIKVLAMPAPSGDRLEWMREKIRTASRIRAPNLTDILGMGTTEEGKVYVAMEYIEGQSLSRALAKQREKGREIGLHEMFHVIAHICEGLEVIHDHLVHGLLTPFNIYIADDGQVKIQNLGFGQISARYLHSEGKGPFLDSIYVGPEVAEDPDHLAPSSDLYSAGMITAEMLSGGGLPRQKGQARDVAARIAQTYSDGIHRLVGTSLARDPSKRTSSTAEFRMALENAVKEAGVDPADGLPEQGLPVKPAVEVRGGDAELFDIPGPDESQEVVTEEKGEERYLVRKEGLDYGPFTKDEVLDQLYDDEIDEHTSVLDRTTQERAPLGEQDEFVEEVEEYIPIREERKRKERERREEIERKVKQGGKAVLVVGILAGLVVLAGMSYYYFTRPDPKELPVDKAFVALDYKFLPPPKEFKTVSADEDVLEQIFNPNAAKEDIAKQVQQARGGGGGGGGSAGGGGGDGAAAKEESSEQEVNTVDLGSDKGSDVVLTDRKINNIILSDFSALRRCVQKELKNNPSFNGVTVKFYIPPNGTTGGVTLQQKQYLDKPVGGCLVRKFRQMKFPAHSAVSNKGVTFPLKIKR